MRDNYKILKNKTILVTGGTGSFGSIFVERLINKSDVKNIIIFSRDEMKQWKMQEKYKNKINIQFIIGDVKDKERLNSAMNKKVDYVIHAAATKIVPTAEKNPEECIKTNIIGAMNVIESCKYNKIKKIIALSTDKASSPINLYGASKLCSDKLFTSQVNNSSYTKFSVVRYGNVLGSRGSVIPFFLSLAKKKYLPITNKDMTRFFLSLDEAVDFVNYALNIMQGGEIFVKKLNAIKIVDLAKIINPTARIKYIGIREGEKIHEQMIGIDDAEFTVEYSKHYEILPNHELKKIKIKLGAKKVKNDFFYSSNNTGKIDSKILIKEIEKIRKREIY